MPMKIVIKTKLINPESINIFGPIWCINTGNKKIAKE